MWILYICIMDAIVYGLKSYSNSWVYWIDCNVVLDSVEMEVSVSGIGQSTRS
jgi:hypothetical protein